MKTRVVAFLVMLALLISCKNEETEINEYYPDGKLWRKTVFVSPKDKDKNYHVYEFYESGSIKSLGSFENGVKQGKYLSFYEEKDLLESAFFYDKGKLSGVGRYWSENGILTDKGLYINDSLVVKEEILSAGKYSKLFVFTKADGEFKENGRLLYDDKNRLGLDNSFYYLVSSLDSVPLKDSIQVAVKFVSKSGSHAHIALSLEKLDENLASLSRDKTYIADSLDLIFYYKPSKTGYNLITGKLLYITDKPKDTVSEFVFYHDFLAY